MLGENINKVSSLSATAREGNVFIGMCQSFCSQRCRTDPHGGRPTLPVLTSSCCHCSILVHILLECILVLKGNFPLPFLLTLHVSFTKKIKVLATRQTWMQRKQLKQNNYNFISLPCHNFYSFR